jgi:phosphate transport system protein
MDSSRDPTQHASQSSGSAGVPTVSHAVKEQEVVWREFLAMAWAVVESLAKGVDAICEGRLEVIPDVKDAERSADREEVRIEQECMRILALYEPVASDLRRLATTMKASRDWERIADVAARIARRARKLARDSGNVAAPAALKSLAHDVLSRVRDTYDALAECDSASARTLIQTERSIDRQYRRLRKALKEEIRQGAPHAIACLQWLGTARNLERIDDHATDIAQMTVYLAEGIIIRHATETPFPRP